jgi:hypothetical protein
MDDQGIRWNRWMINKVLNGIQFREMIKATKVNEFNGNKRNSNWHHT